MDCNRTQQITGVTHPPPPPPPPHPLITTNVCPTLASIQCWTFVIAWLSKRCCKDIPFTLVTQKSHAMGVSVRLSASCSYEKSIKDFHGGKRWQHAHNRLHARWLAYCTLTVRILHWPNHLHNYTGSLYCSQVFITLYSASEEFRENPKSQKNWTLYSSINESEVLHCITPIRQLYRNSSMKFHNTRHV